MKCVCVLANISFLKKKYFEICLFQVDNEFFVPHGYLSDEEEDKDEDEVFNPEKEKVGEIAEQRGRG